MSDQGNDSIIDLHAVPDDDIVLSVRNLTKRFDVRRGLLQRVGTTASALDRVSFDVRRGTTTAVVGESGGGKTTLARCMAGLEPPTDGGVYLRSAGARATQGAAVPDEIPVHRLNDAAAQHFYRSCQLITQHSATSLNPRHTITDIMVRALKAYGKSSDGTIDSRVVAALEQVGLGRQDLYRFPADFSTGQLQRITIARALALEPEVLILDEPTASFDISTQAHILNLLVDIQRRRRLTYVLVTHDLSVALHMADDVVVLRTGEAVETGPIESVLQNPQHPYTRRLVEADPELEPGR